MEIISVRDSRQHRITSLEELVEGHVVLACYGAEADGHPGAPRRVVRGPHQRPELSPPLDAAWWYSEEAPYLQSGYTTRSCSDMNVGGDNGYNDNWLVDLTALRASGIVIDGYVLFGE